MFGSIPCVAVKLSWQMHQISEMSFSFGYNPCLLIGVCHRTTIWEGAAVLQFPFLKHVHSVAARLSKYIVHKIRVSSTHPKEFPSSHTFDYRLNLKNVGGKC